MPQEMESLLKNPFPSFRAERGIPLWFVLNAMRDSSSPAISQVDSRKSLFSSLLRLNHYYTTACALWPLIMLMPIPQMGIPVGITPADLVLTCQGILS